MDSAARPRSVELLGKQWRLGREAWLTDPGSALLGRGAWLPDRGSALFGREAWLPDHAEMRGESEPPDPVEPFDEAGCSRPGRFPCDGMSG